MTAALLLSADEARRIALRAQGLIGAPDRRGKAAERVRGTLRRLGAIQLDTISVLARSQELVPFARLGPVGRDAVHEAYWTHRPGAARTFEYWAHAACVLPVEEWPYLAIRRRRNRARGHEWWGQATDACDEVFARLKAEGPLTSTELGGARNGGPWWDWSETKIAVEKLLAFGDVVCVERRGWKRVYDLPERALPPEVLDDSLDDDACARHLLELAGAALGVGTRNDLADYYRLKGPSVNRLLPETSLVPVTVQGWKEPAWASPAALEPAPKGRHRTVLLSPFDSLVWERKRTERVFGFTHRLEAYVPKEKRQHGYFVMPLLAGGKLVGRVDPAREGTTLVARQVSLDSMKYEEALHEALNEAAAWVGCDDVVIERLVTSR